MALRLAILSGLLYAITASLAAQNGTLELKQALAELSTGHYPATIQTGTAAVATFRKRGDRTGEGRALTAVGMAQLYSGDYNAALRNFTAALALARETADVEAAITRLNDIGTVFYYQGRYAEAMQCYQDALKSVDAWPDQPWHSSRRHLTVGNIAMLYQTLGQFEHALNLYTGLLKSPQALPAREQAQLLTNVGALRRRLGDPRKALDTYRAAQALYQRDALRDGEIGVLNNIGIVQAMDLHDFASAATTFSRALSLAEESGDRPLAVHAHLYRGEALYRAGLLEPAARDFQAVADQAHALGELEEGWKALYGLARISAAQGDLSKSNQLLARAVELIESLRASLGGSSLRSDFLADKRDVYDLLIEHTTKIDQVFRLMEQSRARNLRDRRGPVSRESLAEFAARVPAGMAVLEYWLGSSSAAVLWISASATGMRRWTFTPGNLDLAAIPAIFANPQQRGWRDIAAPMAGQLLEEIPVLKDASIHHLTVIPDGALARIPFEALTFPNRDGLLIERFTVSYSPSAALWSSDAGHRAIRWPWQPVLTGFADPAPGSAAGGELTASRGWPRLPEAVREATGIARILGGRSIVHAGSDARKEYLGQAIHAPLLHFATHAFADVQDPDRSYILLAPAPPSQKSDYLFLREVYAMPLDKVDLVTASACETDAGKLVRAEGVQSFSRAFLAAGAKSVVTSLWSVGDKSTAELMLRFYAGLSAGLPKAEALRAAKLEFLRSPSAAHPAYWALSCLKAKAVRASLTLSPGVPWRFLCLRCSCLCFGSLGDGQEGRDGCRVLIRIQPQNLNTGSRCDGHIVASRKRGYAQQRRKVVHNASTRREHDTACPTRGLQQEGDCHWTSRRVLYG
ncbi:MAG: CHAT domain-containing tetratricopeptide repeat protein [Acidobacteriota bacterium]|nr:CHAT domain-containing tetratricopeptide repeat protein [Acidobacteriota bacterium]